MGSCIKKGASPTMNSTSNKIPKKVIASPQNNQKNGSRLPSLLNIYDCSKPLEKKIEFIENVQDHKELSLKYKQKGNEFYNIKEYKKALDEYNKAIKLYDKDSLYFTNRALVYKQMKQWKLVIEDCTLAMRINEKNIKAFHLKGIALIEIGKKARFDLGEILKGLNLLENAKDLTLENQQGFIQEIEKNIYRGRKILYLKEKEIKTVNVNKIKTFMNDLLKNAPEIKEKAFSIIDENCSKNIKVPDFLCCKITYDPMKCPLMTPDGISYEKEAIYEHCRRMGCFDPVTRNYFHNTSLITNQALQQAIDSFLTKEPWAYEYEDVLDYNLILL